MDFVRRELYDDDAPIYEFMDRGSVRALVDEHLEGKTNRRLLIWSLLNFKKWCELFLGAGTEVRQVPETAPALLGDLASAGGM